MSSDRPTVAQRYPALAFAVGLVLFALVAGLIMARVRLSASPPILTGTAESGTFWKSPLTNSSNEGFSVKGHLVEVYDSFVVATDPATGSKHVRPHGFYSELVVK